jgi:polygalacturonase
MSVFNVRDYGAAGNGSTIDSPAIQSAIDAAYAAGGGTVHVPAGLYKIGSIQLKSRVKIYLDLGAVLHAVPQWELYPVLAVMPHKGPAVTDADTGQTFRSDGEARGVIWAADAEDIAIDGPGIVDGDGKSDNEPWHEPSGQRWQPFLVDLRNCRRITITNATFRNSRFWTIHPTRCEDIRISGITIDNPLRPNTGWQPNSDGIDPDGCRNMIISDCNIAGNDDCIVLKSTMGDLCENVTVSNCILQTTCAALKLGSESRGTIRNVLFNNCIIRPPSGGLVMHLKDGGTYENVILSNITLENAKFVIWLDISPRNYRDSKLGDGEIRDVLIDNWTVKSRGRVRIEGRPDNRIHDVTMRNIHWTIDGPLEELPEIRDKGWAELVVDPNDPTAASEPVQFAVMHTDRLRMENVRLRYAEGISPDRGLGNFIDVRDSQLAGVDLSPANGIESLHLQDCQNIQTPDA